MNVNAEQSIFEYHDLIEAIVEALEMRDKHTLHHSERVSNMTELICRRMELPIEEIRLYHMAADLHDIGKLGVRDAVLLKKGSLNEEEWEEMKQHTTMGSHILGRVRCFQGIAEIVRHHHERWDGTGYPDGLAGEAIPFGARVIAVLDSIDAMLSNRSYRRAMTEQECRGEIEKNIWKMYDGSIAAVVLDNWDEVLACRKAPAEPAEETRRIAG